MWSGINFLILVSELVMGGEGDLRRFFGKCYFLSGHVGVGFEFETRFDRWVCRNLSWRGGGLSTGRGSNFIIGNNNRGVILIVNINDSSWVNW